MAFDRRSAHRWEGGEGNGSEQHSQNCLSHVILLVGCLNSKRCSLPFLIEGAALIECSEAIASLRPAHDEGTVLRPELTLRSHKS